MRIPKREEDNKDDEIDKVGSVNRKEEGKRKNKAKDRVRRFLALDF